MRLLQLFIVFAAFAVFNSCAKDDPFEIENESASNRIQFDKLEVGQKSMYLFFIGENYDQNQWC